MHYLQWLGKKNTKSRGVSLGEVFVLVVIIGLLAMTLAQARQERAEHVADRQCVEKKQQWVDILARIEHSIRKWEAYAPACILSGVLPLDVDPNKQIFTVWDLVSATPLKADMENSDSIVVPTNHGFSMRDPLIICSAYDSQVLEIANILPIDDTSVVIKLNSSDQESKRFSSPATATTFTKVTYSLAQSTAGHQTIIQTVENQTPKEIGRGLDHFEAKATKNGTISMSVGQEHCFYQRSFNLSAKHSNENDGRWLVNDSGLKFVPWPIGAEG